MGIICNHQIPSSNLGYGAIFLEIVALILKEEFEPYSNECTISSPYNLEFFVNTEFYLTLYIVEYSYKFFDFLKIFTL